VFKASDSLGWVYQFWQANNKERINKSEVKIGARELPAVTQLFTEPYMVSFLLDNALGAWWAARRLSESDFKQASSEAELRQKAAIPGVPLEYLRFVKTSASDSTEGQSSDEIWTPAAGTFDLWPKQLSDLKTLDPCCGSGHFLVAAFLMLVPMRMALEDLTAREAVNRVLSENLHGLELDQRCVELAAFALALTAWRYPDAGGYRPLPELHIACSGLSVSVAKEEWKQLGLGKKNLTIALDWLHDTFKDAPVLGSLLNPAKTQAAHLVQWDELSQILNDALALTPNPSPKGRGEHWLPVPLEEGGDEQHEIGVVAQGLAKAATLLAGQYQWVITNVPYLARGKQDERLRDFCEQHYPAAKNDLATVFLDRCLQLATPPSPYGRGARGEGALGGTVSVVLPQNWLFLTTYKKFREQLLTNDTWHLIARLGAGAFETISGEVVKAIGITLSRGNGSTEYTESTDMNSLFSVPSVFSVDNTIRGVDVSEPRTAAEKAAGLLTAEIQSVPQAKQLENPDLRMALVEADDMPLLEVYCSFCNGMQTGDYPRFGRCFWEFPEHNSNWVFYQSTVSATKTFAGREGMLYWQNGRGDIASSPSSVVRGTEAWNKKGVSISATGQLYASLYSGTLYDENTVSLIPSNQERLAALWSFCSSAEYYLEVRKINQTLKVRGDLIKIPFDFTRWTKVAEEKYPNGLPKPYTNDPTQWIFHGHPCGSVVWDEETQWTAHGPLRTDETVLQVAVARLLGYRWPAELDTEMELAAEQREWVKRCEALSLTPALSHGEREISLVDEDGIVCIPPVRGEAAASERLLNLLATAYNQHPSPSGRGVGGEGTWSNDILTQLLNSADHAGKTLETWLRDKFFTQHCKLFQHRPFIWHIWDGLRDGFAALVNYHKLDAKLLETLIYTYLGDWISRQKQDIGNGVDGAEEKLAAAENLKKKLELILAGEAPYDIFVRWKPIEEQPIGWNPDLNDGVRLNIRPFMTVPDVGKRGAGVLRDKPNIKWDKDRGKDMESAPWFHVFNGDRINDHHLSLAEKKVVHEKLSTESTEDTEKAGKNNG